MGPGRLEGGCQPGGQEGRESACGWDGVTGAVGHRDLGEFVTVPLLRFS